MSEDNGNLPLKVSDIVDFKQEVRSKLKETTDNLDRLSKDYLTLEDPFELDKLKREFNSHLQRLAELFSKIKTYKGPNHIYLEEARKKLKAQALQEMQKDSDKKIAATLAKELVYDHPYYVERLKLIETLMKLFIRTELLYGRYEQTLQCIIQSISLYGKVFDRDHKMGD